MINREWFSEIQQKGFEVAGLFAEAPRAAYSFLFWTAIAIFLIWTPIKILNDAFIWTYDDWADIFRSKRRRDDDSD